MNKRRNWKVSSSNLRLFLRLIQTYNLTCSVSLAQFYWLLSDNTWFLYNKRSHLILATARQTNGTWFIRYRKRSRYRTIVEEWANDLAIYKVVIPSNHVSRWERRMRFLLDTATNFSREGALDDAVQTDSPLSDGLFRRYRDLYVAGA